MTTTGHMDLGAAQIINPATGAVIGYAYTVESRGGQLQRWLLHQDPENRFDVRPPPPDMASWTLADWQANVPRLWKPGSHYVWAQADVYKHGGTYNGVTWTRIPGTSDLPPPRFFERPDLSFQLDPTGGKIIDILQELFRGMAYTLDGLRDATSIEYWMLPASFKPAGKLSAATIRTGSQDASTLDDFLDIANRSWGEGCAFVITACTNYHGDRAPASP